VRTVIEPTDEMIQAAIAAFNQRAATPGTGVDECLRASAIAVLAIVERDHCIEARGHVIQTRCGAVGPDGITCQRARHHANHAAGDDQDRLVRW